MIVISKEGRRFKVNEPTVSDHISLSEASCNCCGKIEVFHPTVQLFEEARKIVGKPIIINSFYRCSRRQAQLIDSGAKAAKKFYPHTTGSALDLAIPEGYTAVELMGAFKEAAKNLLLPVPRFGHKAYGGAFLHVDYAFMIKPNPCPKYWYEGAEW